LRLLWGVSAVECEICGRPIRGQPYNVIVDGVKLVVCSECAHFSSGWKFEPKPRSPVAEKAPTRRPTIVRKRVRSRKPEELELELVEDYSQQIRLARERLSLSHKNLGRKIGEKVSVLQKLETGKMSPDQTLTRKLEHALRIKLLIPSSPLPLKKETVAQKTYELTLGDIVTVRKRKGREGAEKKRG
jgi:putative transcription factor